MRNYARNITSGTNDFLELHLYPGENGQFQLIEDDGVSNDYLNGIFALTNLDLVQHKDASFKLTIYPVKGYYNGMNNIRKWQIYIHAKKPYKALKFRNKIYQLQQEHGIFKTEVVSGNITDKLEFEFQ